MRVRTGCLVLVSGGLGALGLVAARALIRQGHSAVLLSRSGHPPGGEGLEVEVRALEASARVHILLCDVTESASVSGAFDSLSPGPRGAVVHCAAVLDPAIVLNYAGEVSRFEAVLCPQARGAWNLDSVARQH